MTTKDIEIEMINTFNFNRKFTKGESSDCWLWEGAISGQGYGRIRLPGFYDVYAHRVAYCLSHGSVSTELVIDHICRNRSCVNPSHLREVTKEINAIENSTGYAAVNNAKTSCNNGHELSGKNLRLYRMPSGRITRMCITCKKIAESKFIEKQRLKKRDNREQYRKYYAKHREVLLLKSKDKYKLKKQEKNI